MTVTNMTDPTQRRRLKRLRIAKTAFDTAVAARLPRSGTWTAALTATITARPDLHKAWLTAHNAVHRV